MAVKRVANSTCPVCRLLLEKMYSKSILKLSIQRTFRLRIAWASCFISTDVADYNTSQMLSFLDHFRYHLSPSHSLHLLCYFVFPVSENELLLLLSTQFLETVINLTFYCQQPPNCTHIISLFSIFHHSSSFLVLHTFILVTSVSKLVINLSTHPNPQHILKQSQNIQIHQNDNNEDTLPRCYALSDIV